MKEDDKNEKENKLFQKLIQEKNEQGNTVLHYAAKAGNLKMCQNLKKRGADIHAINKNSMTPLEFSARHGDGKPEDVFKCIEWMMHEVTKGTSILHHAIKNKNWGTETDVAKELIKSGKCNISEKDKDGNTSLHLAAMFDKEKEHKILDLFLEDENITDDDLIKCLTAKNKKQSTPFHIACNVGNPESVQQLIEKGRELDVNVSEILNSRDANKRLPIHTAIDSNNIELLKVLTSNDIDLQMTENDVYRATR